MDTAARVGQLKTRMIAALAAEKIVVTAKDVIVVEQGSDGTPYLTLSLVLPHTAWSNGDCIARELVSALAAEDQTGPAIHLRAFETPEEAAFAAELRESAKKKR